MVRARISNLLKKITILFIICYCCLPAMAKYGGGTGEPDNPYLIYDANQMNAIGADQNDWDKHFKQMADIDLSAYTGTSFNIIGYRVLFSDKIPFTGVFDGNGHTISNFSYTSTDKGNIGLFGLVEGSNAEVKNLGLIAPNVDAGTGWSIGTLVGWLSDGTISNCYVGGGCVSGYTRIGGLVGHNGKGTITNCYSSAGVSGDWRVGGLVGINYRTITDCYSTGSVSGTTDVGGLVGVNVATITNSYASGTVSGDGNVGGLVGSNYSGNVLSCFWDIQTSGQIWSACGTGKTTDQMQDLNTFLYWGACGNEGVWTIDDGNDYPRLAWQNIPGVFIVTYEPVYGGGSGTETDPYQIRTAEQLKTIGLIPCHWDKHFKLMADIDLSAYTGTSFNIIGTEYDLSFTGVFDG
ncbi:MAG: hypothetical protein GWN67_11760, partial [Phycisphaerae bacterium]|nr:hypothetical protein [Phycisphaerae bacterium]NIR62846.1 hypothetical protein [candidate division Zixibacteria bacterium]NIP52737.1 hypothetical protein [Phycisphaerae bacterium]NIS51784.1 hypothetical protein [Phycisphaerae bacterium]NIU57025.1 hypothetical protein [Phycisphaerae bacterium]